MDIKILFSDLDGTLVAHAGEVNQETIDAVKKLRDNGIDLVLISGRHTDMMKSIHYNLGLKTPAIGCNGGFIKDLNSKKVLYINELPEKTVKESIDIARQLDIDWVVYEQNNIFFEKNPPESYQIPYTNLELPEHLRANFVKVNSLDEIFNKGYKFVKTLMLFDRRPELVEKGKNLLGKLENIDILVSTYTYLDVMVKGTSKGTAIKKYIEDLNIKKENIASIGDAGNDIDMIEYAGFGIAMGNAMEKVKKVANYQTSEYPCGFKDAVEYFISQNKKRG